MLYDDLVDVYTGFWFLSAGRQYNDTGPQPIPFSELVAYMNDRRIYARDDREEFERYIRAMDQRYLTLAHERIKKAHEKAAKSQKNSGKGGVRKRG